MSAAAQLRRSEEKAGQIYGQLASIRRRLNSLAFQRAAFTSLAFLIAGGAAVIYAAFLFSAARFLVTIALAVTVALFGSAIAIRRGWRAWMTPARAASLADTRAGMKGRLLTLAQGAKRWRDSRLWPYLVEDALALRTDFSPSRIEPRLISRAIFGLAAACVAALFAWHIARTHGESTLAKAASKDTEVTVPLDDLDVRMAEPGEGDDGTAVSADPETMRRLYEKAAAAQGEGGSFASLASKAESLAGSLQDRLTGRKHQQDARIRLRLAQALSNQPPKEESADLKAARRRHLQHKDAAQFDKNGRLTGSSGPLPRIDPPEDDREARDEFGGGERLNEDGGKGQTLNDRDSPQPGPQDAESENEGGSGFSSGAGADPQHLFGNREEPPLTGEGFEIMVNARSSQKGDSEGSHSYMPPKIRSSLNPTQQPDEPLARGEVPSADREIVRRVFER